MCQIKKGLEIAYFKIFFKFHILVLKYLSKYIYINERKTLRRNYGTDSFKIIQLIG